MSIFAMIIFFGPFVALAFCALEQLIKQKKEEKEEIKREVEDYIRFEKFSKMMRDTDLRLGE